MDPEMVGLVYGEGLMARLMSAPNRRPGLRGPVPRPTHALFDTGSRPSVGWRVSEARADGLRVP